jgi:hypothetical protein
MLHQHGMFWRSSILFPGLLSSQGQILDVCSTLLDTGLTDGETLTAIVHAPKICATRKAFAMWFLSLARWLTIVARFFWFHRFHSQFSLIS